MLASLCCICSASQREHVRVTLVHHIGRGFEVWNNHVYLSEYLPWIAIEHTNVDVGPTLWGIGYPPC